MMNIGLINRLAELSNIETLTDDQKKFAELIIRECSEIVVGYYDERTMQYAGPRIEQYFGLE